MFLQSLPLSYKNLRLRRALTDDVRTLKKWDKQPHVIASGGVNDYIDWKAEIVKKAKWADYLIAEVDKTPVGVLMIIDPALEETHYWGKVDADLAAIDIWIGEKNYLSLGYGSLMMALVLDQCFSQNVKAVLVDPLVVNQRACKFYEKLGFKKIQDKKFDEDDCIIYRIDQPTWQKFRSSFLIP